METSGNQKGNSNSLRHSSILKVFILILAVYGGWKVVDAVYRNIEFERCVKKEMKRLMRSDYGAWERSNLNACCENSGIDYQKGERYINENLEDKTMSVTLKYIVPVATPFHTFEWKRSIQYKGPLFR